MFTNHITSNVIFFLKEAQKKNKKLPKAENPLSLKNKREFSSSHTLLTL